MKSLFLIGAGGHAVSCIDVIESSGLYKIAGLFDRQENVGKKVLGYDVIGTDHDIKKHAATDTEFLITVGQIKTSEHRERIDGLLREAGAKLATVVSPKAHVSRHASLGPGTIVMHFAVVNAGAKVGRCCILNTKSVVEHDAAVSDFCHISTGAIVNGDCRVGRGCFIGSLSTLQEGTAVTDGTIVPAGTFFRRGAK